MESLIRSYFFFFGAAFLGLGAAFLTGLVGVSLAKVDFILAALFL